MARGIMVVQSSPAEGREDEFNKWYRDEHIPEMLAVPGFVGARRYRVATAPGDEGAAGPPSAGGGPAHRYLAIYEIEADDLHAPIAEMRARSAARRAPGPPPVVQTSPPPVVTVYELVD